MSDSNRIKKTAYKVVDILFKNSQLHDYTDFKIEFFTILYIYRFPIAKSATIYKLTLTLPMDLYMLLTQELNNSKFPYIRFKICLLDTLVDPPVETDVSWDFLLNMVEIKNRSELTSSKKSIPVTITCVYPYFRLLNEGNKYNKIVKKKTGYDAIIDYNDWIKKVTENSINITYNINMDKVKTNYVFEQMLLKADNDMNIPDLILNNYKPFNTYCYYFFDDFSLLPDSGVNLFYIDIMDLNNFNLWDVSHEGKHDAITTLKFIKQVAIKDSLKGLKIDLNNSSLIFHDKNGMIRYSKNPQKVKVPNFQSSASTGNINDSRPVIAPSISNMSLKETESTQFTNLYITDNLDNTLIRYNKFVDFLYTKVEAICTYVLFDVHYDVIQLYYKYNFELHDSGLYFVPINVVNIFERENITDPILNHRVKFQALRYTKT